MNWDGSWLLLHPQPSGESAQKLAAAFFGRTLDDAGIMIVTDEGTLKIEHIRTLQQDVSVAPPGGRRIVLITPGERITLPAQQALLKLLEEPPQHTTLAILARSSSAVLPTIQSRCRVEMLEKGSGGSAQTLQRVAQAKSLKEAVEISQGLPTKRDELVALLSEELGSLDLSEPSADLIRVCEKALEVLQALGNNVSPGLCAEELCFFRFR